MQPSRTLKLVYPASVVLLLLILVFSSCKEKTTIVTDNDAPYYDEIPRARIESYVNKLYIDLIGREPLPDERSADVDFLKAQVLSYDARTSIIKRLQTDTTWRDGDTSYTFAYYRQFYEQGKARLLEGAEDSELRDKAAIAKGAAQLDSLLGDSVGMQINKAKARLYLDVVRARDLYRDGEIGVSEVYRRMLRCPFYDDINMNTFNLINAAFNDLYFRYPTDVEFDAAFDMIEYNISSVLFLESGANYLDFCRIVSHSREFHEGMIRWAYLTLVARDPDTDELSHFLSDFIVDGDFQKIQLSIMATDEYANF